MPKNLKEFDRGCLCIAIGDQGVAFFLRECLQAVAWCSWRLMLEAASHNCPLMPHGGRVQLTPGANGCSVSVQFVVDSDRAL